ncbi:hypothetical protein K458DRAFT_305793, partial [Lentithecium fluviatile CBS 122367]
YNTASRTRSRTLFPFMHIPEHAGKEVFLFGSTNVRKFGPCWSCLLRSCRHKKQT